MNPAQLRDKLVDTEHYTQELVSIVKELVSELTSLEEEVDALRQELDDVRGRQG